MGAILRKYGVQTDFYFPMVKRGVVDLAASADWTPATGDTKVSKDGGSDANTTNNPAAPASTAALWKLTLTATEMEAAKISVRIVDSATKAVEDQFLLIETYGHASAEHAFDLDDAEQDVNVTKWGGTAVASAYVQANVEQFNGNDVPNLPSNFNLLSIDASGRVDLGKWLGGAPSALSSGLVQSSPSITVLRSGLGVANGDLDTQLTAIKGATFDTATDSLEALRNRGDAAWITATGFSTHSAADVVTALGTGSTLTALATATSLSTVAGYLDTEIAAILADTNELQTDLTNGGRLDLLIDAILADTNELQTDWTNGGRLDLLVDAILDDTGTSGVAVAAGSKTGYTLAAAGLDSVVVETGLNGRQALSIIAAGVAGVLAGAATTSVTIAAAGVPATNRISATVDSSGNRTAVTLSAPT